MAYEASAGRRGTAQANSLLAGIADSSAGSDVRTRRSPRRSFPCPTPVTLASLSDDAVRRDASRPLLKHRSHPESIERDVQRWVRAACGQRSGVEARRAAIAARELIIRVTFSLMHESEVAQIRVCQSEAGTAAATSPSPSSASLALPPPPSTSRPNPDPTAHSALYM